MKIENINIAIFHKGEAIHGSFEGEHIYNLGKKTDDNFDIEFESDKPFLVFQKDKENRYTRLFEKEEFKIKTKLSAHQKLALFTIKENIVSEYSVHIIHDHHQSLLYIEFIKEIKIYTHSNGLPDSHELERKTDQVLINALFSKIEEIKATII